MPASRARRTRVVLETVTRFELEQLPVVAIKLGGSLLDFPQLIERLEWLLDRRPLMRPLLICGGGTAAETVRHWQAMHKISDADAHRLALAAMSFNERLLHSALPNSRLVGDLVELEEAWDARARPILRTADFIDETQAMLEEPLPETWEMTSDSIAAWCARLAGADELILAKSADLPESATLESARQAGLVDAAFGQYHCPEVVSWVNLRAERPVLADWH